ncbi:YmfQ family protein [Neobacillus mesonae]|nr:YmfQ family protein [Neobacillus mesonae]
MATLNEIKRDMHDSVPRYYEDSKIAVNILDREAEQLAKINADIYDVLAQFFIETATWGLARWEAIFGITPSTTQTYEQRREVILGKMRGVGTVTAELIESVARAYSNGNVAVTADVPAYTIKVEFVGEYGVPAQLDELQRELRNIIPAHLDVAYKFKFYTYGEMKATRMTYEQIAATGLTYEEILNGGIG